MRSPTEEARRSVRAGDVLYYHGPGGTAYAPVVCHGQHGVTLDIGGTHTPVRWEHVLGHRERVSYPVRIVDQGEDGAIVEEDGGEQTFIEGLAAPDPETEQEPDPTAWDTVMTKALFFFKAQGIKNRPGLHLEAETDRGGHQVHRWKRSGDAKGAKPGQGVTFQGEHGKPVQGEVTAAGQHGVTVRDERGGQHQVKHGDYRPRQGGAAAGYGTHDIQPEATVKFKAGDFSGKGTVAKVGDKAATVHDSTGRAHEIGYHEITHYQPPDGAKKPEIQPAKPLGKQDSIAADQFVAADYAKSHDQADVSPDSVLAQFPPDTKDRIAAAQNRLAGIEETIAKFRQKDGTWSDDRAKLHDKIMGSLFTPEKLQAAKPAPGEKPTFIILGGRGGSGKSSFAGTVYDPHKFIVLDADHIKGMLPEYEGWNAQQVHEESGDIFDAAVALARKRGLNVVQDKTMKTAKSALADVQAFKDAGYRTEAHYMHLPRQEAAKRAVGRFLGGGEKGRYVPVSVVLSNTTNEAAFDQVRPLVDDWSFRDNNVPKGASPILISQKQQPLAKSAILFFRR